MHLIYLNSFTVFIFDVIGLENMKIIALCVLFIKLYLSIQFFFHYCLTEILTPTARYLHSNKTFFAQLRSAILHHCSYRNLIKIDISNAFVDIFYKRIYTYMPNSNK